MGSMGMGAALNLAAKGFETHGCERRAEAWAELQAAGAMPLKLDVTQPESLAGLGWQLDGAKLDLAVYVAGVYGPSSQQRTAPTVATAQGP